MSLSKLQKVVVRNTLRYAHKMRINDERIHFQIAPSKDGYQRHSSYRTDLRDREILEVVYPPELHDLIGQYPSSILDGGDLRSFILSAVRLKRHENKSSTERVADADLALDAYRRLSIQRKLSKSTSIFTSHAVRIIATSTFDEEYNNDFGGGFIHFYRISIANLGTDVVQAVGRQWKIVSFGDVDEIRRVPAFSPGLIGINPMISPGEMFEYTSCAVTLNKRGVMEGSLLLVNYTTGDNFEVDVKPFSLNPE